MRVFSWSVIVHFHESTSGHAKTVFPLARQKIKEAHKELEFGKPAQSAFYIILSGDAFKEIVGSKLKMPLFPACKFYEMSWAHFFSALDCPKSRHGH